MIWQQLNPLSPGRWYGTGAVLGLAWAIAGGVELDGAEADPARGSITNRLRGAPIRPLRSPAPGSAPTTTTNLPAITLPYDEPERMVDGYLRMGFGTLSSFKYELYEVDSGPGGGRPLLKSDDTIPERVKAYDGRRVSIPGFILPMRTKGGLVTEFLLLRDLGTCCFGPQAQINHFMRVKLAGRGFEPDLLKPYRVSGTLHVGETYVQRYLTGVYRMDADRVVEEPVP